LKGRGLDPRSLSYAPASQAQSDLQLVAGQSGVTGQ